MFSLFCLAVSYQLMYDVRLPRSVVIPSFSLYMVNDQTEDLN